MGVASPGTFISLSSHPGGVAQGARWGNLPIEIYPVIFTVDVDPDGIGDR